MKSSLSSVSLIGIIVILAAAFGGITPAKAETAVFINEIHYDNDGTDVGEAIEIAGPAGTDITGWSVVLYNGNDGAPYGTETLSGVIADSGDGYGFIVLNFPVNGIQNGAPDGLALVNNLGDVVQFLSYEGTFLAVGGPADGLTSTDIGVAEDGGTLIGESLQLTGVGMTDDDFSWTAASASTFGTANNGQTFIAAFVITPIYDIQYTTDVSGDSPFAGQIVNVDGIVSAVFQYGYFIEDPAGGAWNGLWVYDSINIPAIGDKVRLTGSIAEYYNLTELDSPTSFQVLSSGNPVPTPVVLATVDVNQEQWEGVMVQVNGVTVTNPDLGTGEWSVSDGSGDVVIDDKGSYTYSPADGDALDTVIGPLDYSYGAFKIQPRDDADIILGLDYTPIYDIQYTTGPSGDSPYVDQIDIITEGIVTAVFYNGYFIEDPAGGAWNGLWVYDLNTPALGDLVRLTGTVVEYNNLTQLGSLSIYEILSSGNPIPTPVVQSSADVSQEMWEGVLVRVENVTVTNDSLGYGEWSVSDGTGDVVIDDKGSYTYSPADGDALDAVIGPLDYLYGAFKIQPRDDADIIQPAPPPDVLINEVDSDTPSYDTLEFIELYDGGDGSTALDGFVVVLMNGSDDASYDAFDLDGYSTDADGYFVIGTVAGADLYVAPGSQGWLQNGADAVALYVGDAADFPNDTPVTTASLIDAIVYDTDDSDDAGLLPLLNMAQPQINEDGLGDKDNQSNQRCPNGSGGARNTDTFTQFAPTPGAANCVVPLPDILINEIDSDTPSYDALEFIELYDGGDGSTALDGFVVVLMNGSDDASYDAFDLDGYSTDADGYFVIGTVAGADLYVAPGSQGWLQNGADAVALYVGDAVDFPNDTPVTTASLIDAIVYDTNDEDDAALLTLLNSGQPQVNEGGNGDKDNHSNQRCPNGDGGARNTDTYDQWAPTPGAENICEIVLEFGQCGDPTTAIHAIQGNGASSPEVGNIHVIEGIVVGDFQTSAHLRGFFLQEENGDTDEDPATSEGIFVYDGSVPAVDVQAGEVVRVMGSVTEYYDLTELTSITNAEVCGTGIVTAAEVSLPVSTLDVWEWYEGMLIHVPQTLYVTGNYYQGRYGEVDLSVFDRLDNPTNVVLPGADALALQDLNDRSRLQLEDGSTSENPVPAPYMGEENTLRAGDTLPGLTGVLHYGFGAYELHPTGAVEFARANDRPHDPPDVGGELKVASFNVLNYFSTVDDGDWICGPSGDMECRGADSAEEFTRQRTKIINAILALDADVVGLMEIENHADDNAVQDLVNGLNDIAGPGTFAYVATGPIGTDAIKVALIYKPASVTPEGTFAVLDSSVDPTFNDTHNRPVLLQTFMENASGELFSVAVNHLKSKGSACDDIGDPDLGDGQGNCNLTRTSAAIALANWLGTDPTGSGDPDFLIIGDLNAYAMEDPVAALRDAGYIDLIQAFSGAGAYSYVYIGQSGYLDHGLTTDTLAAQVTGTAIWHINTDEPAALDYNDYNQPDLYTEQFFRASDHDPVVIGLSLIPQCAGMNATIYVSRDGLIVGGPFDGRSYKHMIRGTAADDVMVGTSGSDYLFGFQGDDVMCGLGGNDVLNGREGDDVLYAGSGNDVLIGWKGNDILYGGDGHDVLVAFFGDDLLYAGDGRDVLNGGHGYDECDGGDGRDHAVHCEVKTNIP